MHCNGLIVLTAINKAVLSDSIVNAVDYLIELEPFTTEQLKLIVHQRLKFIGIDYDGEGILEEIVGKDIGIEDVIRFLKKCVLLLQAEHEDLLDYDIVQRAIRLDG